MNEEIKKFLNDCFKTRLKIYTALDEIDSEYLLIKLVFQDLETDEWKVISEESVRVSN